MRVSHCTGGASATGALIKCELLRLLREQLPKPGGWGWEGEKEKEETGKSNWNPEFNSIWLTQFTSTKMAV